MRSLIAKRVFTMDLIPKVTQYADTYYKQIRFLYKLLAFLGMLVYLGYHSLSGTNGYKSYKVIKKEVEIVTKITYTYEDGSTKEINEVKKHNFDY